MKTDKKIFLASDHAGFVLKRGLIDYLKRQGILYVDLGTHSAESCNYPDYGHDLATKVSQNKNSIGIAICGSGIGMSMTVNRHKKIRGARCLSEEDAYLARQHNNANVLILGSRQTGFVQALKFLDIFLMTEFEGGRHALRIEKI